MLQSVLRGAVAEVANDFSKALLDGLGGKGIAKVWTRGTNNAMFVNFELLRSYLDDRFAAIDQALDGDSDGPTRPSKAPLATLAPVPLCKCTISIDNASSGDAYKLLWRGSCSPNVQSLSFRGQQTIVQFEPDSYSIVVATDGARVEPEEGVQIDLYDDAQLVFKKEEGLGAVAASPERPRSNVSVNVPMETKIELRNIFSGDVRSFEESTSIALPRGRYVASLKDLKDKNDKILRRREIPITSELDRIDLGEWQNSPPHRSIASMLLHPPEQGRFDFSELLGGPIADTDLNIWLALLGASRIFGTTIDFSKLTKFLLHDFVDEKAGASPVYIVAGFDDVATKLKVGLSKSAEVDWNVATQPPGLQGIQEHYLPAPAGPCLVSVMVGDLPPYTIASCAEPNRATLVTLTRDEKGNPYISQYLLPIGHLRANLDPAVAGQLSNYQLKDLMQLAEATRAFRKRRDLATELPGFDLSALISGKWLDPIGCAMAAYEYARRGRLGNIEMVVENMQRYFGELPDTSAIAKLAGVSDVQPKAAPLFFDGLRAFPDYATAGWLPLRADHLDFTSPWTAWWNAVRR